MNKIFYIGPGMFIDIRSMKNNVAEAYISVDKIILGGEITFVESSDKKVCAQLTIKFVPNPPLAIDILHERISKIIQNYEQIARVMGGAWLEDIIK